jgi:hypothetical protein
MDVLEKPAVSEFKVKDGGTFLSRRFFHTLVN